MADTTEAKPVDRCTCPMSLRERGQHSLACELSAGLKAAVERRIAELRAAHGVRHA